MSDRERTALSAIISALVASPELRAALAPYTVHEYRVQSVAVVAGPPRHVKVNAKYAPGPDDPPTMLPDIVGIVVWPGPDGCYAEPAPGSSVRVGFLGGSLARPMIVGLDPMTPPTRITLGQDGDAVALAAAVAKLQTNYNGHTHAANGAAFVPSEVSFGSTKVKAAL
jgi:hypothetical protein